ncbi:HAD family hydrolase [Lentzea sp. HUAS TT2]|uniref:HAD family hydrolase n=1 Tax=Lentzea sp. HUAS TT2 TaxID=3447454 RepID=UPI003F6E9718
MTEKKVLVDDSAALRRLLIDTSALLLDFDGPVCSVFAGFPAPAVAEQLREVLAGGGYDELPPEIQKTNDPFDVLSFAATLGGKEAHYIEASLRAHEVEAVATAQPTEGAHDLIRSWSSSRRKLAIVSNNSTAAVEAYLSIHGLVSSVDLISARNDADPSLLKPHPFLIDRAKTGLHEAARSCTLIGDSVTDIQAARAAGVSSIGYANKPGKTEALLNEFPDVVITDVTSVYLEALTL